MATIVVVVICAVLFCLIVPVKRCMVEDRWFYGVEDMREICPQANYVGQRFESECDPITIARGEPQTITIGSDGCREDSDPCASTEDMIHFKPFHGTFVIVGCNSWSPRRLTLWSYMRARQAGMVRKVGM